MSVDSTRLQDLTPYLHAIWYSFYQIIVALYLLWGQVSYSSLAGVVIIIVTIPLTGRLSMYLKSLQKKLSGLRDERVRLCCEVFGGIKVIKLQSWEREYAQRIDKARENELDMLKK